MPVVRQMLSQRRNEPFQLVFVTDNKTINTSNGYPVYSREEFFSLDCDEKFFNITIGNSKIREKISTDFEAKGIQPFSIIADNAILYDHNDLAEGLIMNPFTTITSNIKIGKYFHCNLYSYVGHDCQIGDFVTFAPGVKCNGSVIIEDHAYIGTGAIIKQSTPDRVITIGKGATVGMGAVVTKSVPPGAIVVGNPAKPMA